MYNNCVASSSPQSSTERYWENSPDRRTFPTSAIRFEANTHEVMPLRQTSPVFETNASRTSYPTHVPQWSQIEMGIWSDGTAIVLSSRCPDVQHYLAQAHYALQLPPAPSEEVFVLAALEVFYAPTNPVHWMFWSDERKSETAEVVTRVALHPRQKIQSSVKWNGTPEYLSILGNLHHSPAWREMFEHKHWFSILVPPKVKSPAKGPNLRKRKPGQVALRDLSESHLEEDGAEAMEPAPKRPRTNHDVTRVASVRRGSNEQSNESSTNVAKLEMMEPSSSSSSSLPPTQSSLDQLAVAELETSTSQSGDFTTRIRKPPPKRASARQKQRKVDKESLTPELTVTPSSFSVSPSLPPPSMTSHSRSRSISQASAETLVASRPRSLSGVSAATAVEVANAIKRKGLVKVDEVEIELEEAEKKPKVAEIAPRFQMVTRASARTATSVTAATEKSNGARDKRAKTGRGKGENTATTAKGKRGKKVKR